jgi:hypothetical protein
LGNFQQTGQGPLAHLDTTVLEKVIGHRDNATSGIVKVGLSVVQAKTQTVEDMYRLIWTAIAKKQPITAIYKEFPRLFCPHRLGRNRIGQPRVLCYQYGGESESGLGPIGRRRIGVASFSRNCAASNFS